MSPAAISDEWTRLTFGNDATVRAVVNKLEMDSWHIYESYAGPLGLGTLTDIVGAHFGLGIESAERNGWGHWLRADHDGIGMDRIEAAALGKSLEDFQLFWLEDATPAENQEAFRLIRQHTTTPLAVGEVFNSIFDCKQLIAEQWIDYIRATVTHAGGITHLRRIVSFADFYGVRTGCHGPTDISPIGMGAALHFDLSVPNFGIQEHMAHAALTDEVFPHAYSYANGMMHPGEAPGHGVEIDETLAARFPYQQAYLPVCRLEDGTMHSW